MTPTLERVALDDVRWRSFADDRSDVSIFHRPQWSALLAGTYGYDAFAIIATRQQRTIAGAPFLSVGGPFRRRWSSLPFTDACAPLGDPEAVDLFVGGLLDQAAGAGISSVELRCDLSRVAGHARTVGVSHTLPLTGGTEAATRRISAAHARNVRQARRHGVEVSLGRDPDDMEAFYDLHLRTRRRLGVPAQPIRFFRQLAQFIVAPGLGFIALARIGSQPIAAAVFLSSGSTLVYKYGASDEREWLHRPNDALFQTVIEDACHRGYAALDFGRTDIDDAGLRRFKSSWGAAESELRYTTLGQPVELGSRLAVNILAPVIRRSSPLVCRAIGEALYRYSA